MPSFDRKDSAGPRGPLAGIAIATLAFVATSAIASPLAVARPSVELVSPARGATIGGGTETLLEWRALAPLGAEIEEWEAFLSLDGGRTYPIRLTPHLDRDIHRFSFRAPNLPTEHAHLLLRFGNEVTERVLETSFDFAIASTQGLPLDFTRDAALASAVHAGEAARPDLAGTIAWTEGTREGRDLREMRIFASSLAAADAIRVAGGNAPLSAALLPKPTPKPLSASASSSSTDFHFVASAPSRASGAASTASTDRLALLVRLNS